MVLILPPLLGGRGEASDLKKAKQKKKQNLLELKSVEIELANEVDTVVRNVISAYEQVKYSAKMVDINKKLLEVEMSKLEAGKSNSRDLFEKEDQFRKAQETELKSIVNYQKNILELQVAEGTLLASFGIEIMKDIQ